LEAVSLRDSQEVVFVYQDGKALQKPVRSGVSDDKNIELLEGPSEGTLLIVRPYETLQTLRDSTPVRLKSR
jgi:HlyD family secretion protein